MDLPALQQTVTALEKSLDAWEFWLGVATSLVVAGLVLEYWHEVRDLIKDRPVEWKTVQKILGAILVTVGVAGELGIQVKAARLDTRLRAANQSIETLLSAAASDAQGKANNAVAVSQSAEGLIAAANQAASEANARAAQATALTESEKLERVKLEAQVAPRSLSLDQQTQIAAACEKFRGHNVLVSSYGLDGEGALLGAQLIAVLKAAHVSVLDNRASSVITGGFELGVHVRGPDSERNFISQLGNALSSIGHLQVFQNDAPPKLGTAIFGGGQAFPSGTVYVSVMVGIKPVPILPVPK